ncbi:MAG: hypothetical protein ACSLEL_01035 [Candidatus Malihini olakiniferum]
METKKVLLALREAFPGWCKTRGMQFQFNEGGSRKDAREQVVERWP